MYTLPHKQVESIENDGAENGFSSIVQQRCQFDVSSRDCGHNCTQMNSQENIFVSKDGMRELYGSENSNWNEL